MTDERKEPEHLQKYEPPEQDLADAAHAIARAGLSLIPLAAVPSLNS